MIDGLMKYFSSDEVKDEIIKKQNIAETLDNIITNINDSVLPTLTDIVNLSDEEIKDINNSHYFVIMKNVSKTNKSGKEYFINTKKLFEIISNSESKLKQAVNKLNPTVSAMSIKTHDAIVVKLINDLCFMTFYTLDFINVVLTNKSDLTHLPKYKAKAIEDNLSEYLDCLNKYKDIEKDVVDKLSTLPSAELNLSDISLISFVTSTITKATGLIPISNGFVGNPIYHIRLWRLDKQHEKYEANKARRQIASLKIADLKHRVSSGSSEANLDKQIQFYEKQLSDTEYDIIKYEKE